MQILLLERGDVIEQPTTDLVGDLEFESPHFPSPRHAIHNQFGGMAAIWNARFLDGVTPAARYLPLDPIDFESRHWIPHSGWPITLAQLARFYDRARKVCGVGPFDFHGPSPATGRPPLPSPSGASLTRLEQLGSATVFTHQRLVELTKTQRVRCGDKCDCSRSDVRRGIRRRSGDDLSASPRRSPVHYPQSSRGSGGGSDRECSSSPQFNG